MTERPLPDAVETRLIEVFEGPDEDRELAIEQLVMSHPEHEDVIRRRVGKAESVLRDLSSDERRPRHIGPYRILDVLGEGGMGTVYVAEQREPVRRRVALKVIKLGMDTVQVLRRFEAERQALAMMEHNNIARVYEAGTTEKGQPYFAMEHVPGLPITEYCDKQRLSTKERLGLFQRVCAGVQHAHQKGVIHRDLKPSNILITEQQGGAAPKIIDFGVAKATDHRLTEATLFTQQGYIIGTPEYMSPEQAEMTSADIDTRTDIYSLGVILYELLAGQLPFEPADLRRAGLVEIQRKIREDDPPKPSTKITAAQSEHVAKSRKTSIPGLLRELRGDLDWIVMMAMDKDRNRRYGSANELAADLQHHMDHEPVVARPPSAGYRIGKLVRRYRGQVAAAALVFVSLVAGIILFAFANARADLNLENFNLLANVVSLREAKEAEQDLYPAWPEHADALRAWIVEQGEPLERNLPELQRTLEELRAQALEPTPEDIVRWVQTHPRFPELNALRNKRAALERAREVRAGKTTPVDIELGIGVPKNVSALNRLAWPLVSWNETERVWGREAEGLGLARLAWESAKQASSGEIRAQIADTLAWALFANGLDDEAHAASETALAEAPEELSPDYQGELERLRRAVLAAQGDAGINALTDLSGEIESLRAELSVRGEWLFADPPTQFLHNTLATLVSELEDFVDPIRGQLAGVRERLPWAENVEGRSVTAHAAKWREARAAILAADGVVASELYAEYPVDLQPQMGLAPIGMNPKTGLWEFYHLRSAANPDSIPVHDEEGHVRVTPDTGIVFVLIPGGTFLMGAQKDDPGLPNFDPEALWNETPHHVDLEPYFLARHELTQAQWKRLSRGEEPSFYRAGQTNFIVGGTISSAHPVESVTWTACYDLMRQHGLRLPGEAEWEYACRAGSDHTWFSGDDESSLQGFVNVLDATGAASVSGWAGNPVPFDDAHILHAPVGSFAGNAFGLHDVHGNVREWCDDLIEQRLRAIRGGDFSNRAGLARSAYRNSAIPTFPATNLGMRAARTTQ